MKQIIETKRLILREFELEDSKKLWELNCDPDVIKFTGDKPFSSIKKAKEFLNNYRDYQINGYGRWAVILKSTNEFIGWCGLKLNEDSKVDIGFRFFKKYWNNGYATESATACLQHGFNILKLTEIIGRASVDNIASINILEKIQMNYWKTELHDGIGNSVYYKINSTK